MGLTTNGHAKIGGGVGRIEEFVLHVSERRVVGFKVMCFVVEIHGDELGRHCGKEEGEEETLK